MLNSQCDSIYFTWIRVCRVQQLCQGEIIRLCFGDSLVWGGSNLQTLSRKPAPRFYNRNIEVHEIAQPPFREIDPVLGIAAPIDRRKNWISASSLSNDPEWTTHRYIWIILFIEIKTQIKLPTQVRSQRNDIMEISTEKVNLELWTCKIIFWNKIAKIRDCLLSKIYNKTPARKEMIARRYKKK